MGLCMYGSAALTIGYSLYPFRFGIAFDPKYNRAIAVLLTDWKYLTAEYSWIRTCKGVTADYKPYPYFGRAI